MPRTTRRLAEVAHFVEFLAATVLSSPRAVEVSIYVVRAFVQLRELLAGYKELAKRLDQLEATSNTAPAGGWLAAQPVLKAGSATQGGYRFR